MTFEEDFPSLKGLLQGEHSYAPGYVKKTNVQKYLLDKQKVREAIDFWTKLNGHIESPKALKKELGL